MSSWILEDISVGNYNEVNIYIQKEYLILAQEYRCSIFQLEYEVWKI